MAETTSQVTCRDCGATFQHESSDGRRTKKYCKSCRLERVRINLLNHARKRRAKTVPKQRACLDCPTDLTGAPARAVRCKPCSTARRTEAQRVYQAQYRADNPKVAEFFCATCGAKIDREGRCGIATYCDGCRPAARKACQQRADAKLRERRGTTMATHCFYCGVEFDEPRFRAKAPNRCDECQKDRHRAYIRSYWAKQPRGFDHVRRARKMGLGFERFKHMEIFDRDRWRCGICRRHIGRQFRWPHPMSVSLDHKVPLSKGGPHSRSNTQAAHLRCNLRKRDHVAPFGEQIPLPF